MFCRARTPNFFQVRANMMIKKKSVKTFCCYDQNQQPLIFSLLLFFVGICCRNKKMLPKCCPRMKKTFLFRKFSSKSLSNVSSDPGHRWSIFFSEKGRHKKKFPHGSCFCGRGCCFCSCCFRDRGSCFRRSGCCLCGSENINSNLFCGSKFQPHLISALKKNNFI